MTLGRPRLVASDRSTVAQFDRLALSGLNLLWGANQVIDARANNLQARLVRLPNGRFEIEDLLPERSKEPSRLPFRFRLDRAQATLIDRAGKQEWRRTALVTGLRVDGVGDDWVATAGAFVPGIGRASGRIQSVSERGITVTGRTNGLELASLFAHLKTTPERRRMGAIARTDFSSLRVSGPFAVFLPNRGDISVETNLKASAEDVRFERYHADRATFEGLITQKGAKGSAVVIEGPSRGAFTGSLDWTRGFRLGGDVRVGTPTVGDLPAWVRDLVPREVRFEDGVYDGWVTVVDGKAVADGNLSARWLRVANEEVRQPLVRIHFDDDSTLLRLVEGEYMGRNASGVLLFDSRRKTFTGAISSTHTTLEPLVARFPQLRGLTGEATLSMNLTGTIAKPNLNFEARGSAVYRRAGWRPVVVDRFDVTGTYRNGLVAVTRGILQGPAGLVTVLGDVDDSGSLNLRAVGRSLNLGVIDSRLAGRANLNARVTGSVRNPQANGRIELYNAEVEGQGITALAADFQADRNRATLRNLNAYRGAANVTGTLQYRFANEGISGRLAARNVQLDDLFGAGYVGSLSSPSLIVGGTLSSPVVRGTVNARDVVVQGIKIESATTVASLQGSLASISEGRFNLAGGTLDVSGGIDTKTRRGRFVAVASNLEVNQLAPILARYATVRARLNGTTTLEVDGTQLIAANGSGRLDDVELNDTRLGDGPWELRYAGGVVSGDLDVGFLDRFLSLSDLRYDPDSGSIAGRADLYSFNLEDLVGAALPSLPRLTFDEEQRLRAITGVVNLGSTFSGTLDDPVVNVESLQATNLNYRRTDFGQLEARMTLTEQRVDIPSLALTGPVGNVRLTGSVERDGAIALAGELSSVDLAALSVVDARLAQVGGTIDLPFEVSGETDSPVIQASMAARGLFAETKDAAEDETLRFLFDTIVVSEANGLSAVGRYFYRGFQGEIEANAPVEYPFALGGDGQVRARMTVAQRDLKEIASLFDGIDADKTEGYVEGEIRGSGTIENFVLNGAINLKAKSLGFEGTKVTETLDTSLKNVEASLSIGDNQVRIAMAGEGARGGSFASEAFTNVENVRSLAESLGAGGTRALLNNPLRGYVQFDAFHGREEFVGDAFVDGLIDGRVEFSGTLARPRIGGLLTASNVDTILPFFEATNEPGSDLAVNPTFDLRFALGNPARVRTATADIYMNGEGSLLGTLAEPNLHGSMAVDKGSIRFPASTVRLEPGGAIELRYRVSEGETFASLEVELEGRTALTALRYDDAPERYDILLELRGDLLKEGGLDLIATSDPPDLSQERILTLLGSVDLFTSFISSDQRYGTEERFRGALIGYALPVVFDPFTSRVAAALGLEYLNLEYNQYEQATIAFAKALTPELILQGRRQVSSPAPGFEQQYELRMVYRPRRLKGVLRRFSLSVGTDQDRPWKIALEYGMRF
ncbi:MAG TPA: translocation/assembly module TamB domain-containing protein [Fimbriimonas sp.]